MISTNPDAVFDEITFEACKLKCAAEKLTFRFNVISEAFVLMIGEEDEESGIHILKEVTEDFCQNIDDYQTKFQTWRVVDEGQFWEHEIRIFTSQLMVKRAN